MERKTKDEKNLTKIKKLDNKNNRKYSSRGCMRKRIKNSKVISNVKEIGEDGLIYLKSGEVATLIEVKAIDLSLTSNQEKNLFFSMLKALYQIQNLNMKCYKLDEKLNLNANKVILPITKSTKKTGLQIFVTLMLDATREKLTLSLAEPHARHFQW